LWGEWGVSEYISLLLAPIDVVDLTTEPSHSPLTTAESTITILGSGYKIRIIEHILWARTCPYRKDNLLLMLIEHILCVGFCLYCKNNPPLIGLYCKDASPAHRMYSMHGVHLKDCQSLR
jgi:hypothetical protein